ncbi:MAG: ATPase, T2SS/T4P/T4SS family [Gaiellales bacterium]
MEAAHTPWPALGALLVRDGAITPAQLEAALAAKRESPSRRIGEILVDQGVATRTQIARVLAEQHELPFVELNATMIESEAAMLLPEALAKRYTAIPVSVQDDSVVVAVADPTNVMFSDELRLAIGSPVRVVVAPADAIEFAIQKTYDGGTVVELMAVEDEPDVDDDATNVDLNHESPAVVFVNRSIAKALDIGASDIHFTPQAKRLFVRARVDGVMREISSINASSGAAITSRLKIMGGLDIAERRAPQDGRVSIRRGNDTIDVRVAVLPTAHGEKTTLRILAQGDAPSSLADLGMWPRTEAALRKSIEQPFGSVLVVGPTGSGKTTTLYACLQELNDPGVSIVTLEDPVEYKAAGLDQIEINPRAGLTFSSGLRTILRSDPDVILVGEIRDEETASIAFRAAMTGHLVLSTIHAQSAAAAFQRLLDMGVDRGLITTAINCLVAQRLARRVCHSCAEKYEPTVEELQRAGMPMAMSGITLYRAVGCPSCNEIGYRGRVPIFEVLTVSEAIAGLIGSPTRLIHEAAIAEGMLPMRDDGLRLCVAGITTLDEIARVAGH